MKKLLLSLLTTGCFSIDGSGDVAKEVRKVDAFDEVEVRGALRVEIDRGDHALTVEADDNLLQYVETVVRGDRLVLSTTANIDPTKLLIRVSTPRLEKVDASGASTLEIRDIDVDRFELELSGASTVELSGEVEELEIDASGATEVDAIELEAERVEVDGSGATQISVHASEALKVELSGSGELTYGGDPDDLKTDLSGSATIEKR